MFYLPILLPFFSFFHMLKFQFAASILKFGITIIVVADEWILFIKVPLPKSLVECLEIETRQLWRNVRTTPHSAEPYDVSISSCMRAKWPRKSHRIYQWQLNTGYVVFTPNATFNFDMTGYYKKALPFNVHRTSTKFYLKIINGNSTIGLRIRMIQRITTVL